MAFRPSGTLDLSSLPVLLFLTVKAGTLLANLRWFPTLRTAVSAVDNRDPLSRVALLVPMRDETARLPTVLPGLLASGASEVIFLDDESSDGSAELVRTAAASRPAGGPAVRVIDGAPRPAGWTGKTWACHQLADATTAPVLVFCDCDVVLAAGAMADVVAEMNRQRADVFSVFCRQLVGSWGERLLIPLINDAVLCFLPFALLAAPVPAAATASGALLVFHRSGYDKLGGFAAVRSETVEDVAIARRTRRCGLKLGLALGGGTAQVRMYDNYRQTVVGLGRGLTPAVGGRRWLVVLGLGWHLLAYTAPALLARRSRWWAVGAALGVTERLLVEAKTGSRDWAAAVLVAASPLAAVPLVGQAMRRRHVWKGRSYG